MKFRFHPEAQHEYVEAAQYLGGASSGIARAFVAAVDRAVREIVAAPLRWRIVDDPEIRRYILERFPYLIYYRWEPASECVVIYAVAHGSKEGD